MQYAVGFRRLGHDSYYFETCLRGHTIRFESRESTLRDMPCRICAGCRNVRIKRPLAYRRSYGDKAWFGLTESQRKNCWQKLTLFSASQVHPPGRRRFRSGTARVRVAPTPSSTRCCSPGRRKLSARWSRSMDECDVWLNIGGPDCSLPPFTHSGRRPATRRLDLLRPVNLPNGFHYGGKLETKTVATPYRWGHLLLEQASRVLKVHRSAETHDTAGEACYRIDPMSPRTQCAEVKWLASDGFISHCVLLQGLLAGVARRINCG